MATKTLKSKTNYSLQTPTEKRASTAYSNESRRKQSFCDKPTPLDFDTFVPWVCMEWQVPEVVTVLKIAQGLYPLSTVLCSSVIAFYS